MRELKFFKNSFNKRKKKVFLPPSPTALFLIIEQI